MTSPRLIRNLARLTDDAQRYVEEHVELLLAMPDQVRPPTADRSPRRAPGPRAVPSSS